MANGKEETPKETDPTRAGSQPTAFNDDMDQLHAALNRFLALPDDELAPHPLFGTLSKRD